MLAFSKKSHVRPIGLNVLMGLQSHLQERCHLACDQEASPSLPGSRFAIFGRDAKSALLQLVNQG